MHAILVKVYAVFVKEHTFYVLVHAVFVRVYTLCVIVHVLFLKVHTLFGFLKLTELHAPSIQWPHNSYVSMGSNEYLIRPQADAHTSGI